MFYLFFPLACRLFRRDRYLLVPLLMFVVLGPFARSRAFNPNPVWREYSYLGGMDAIALGCLTALALKRFRLSRPLLVIGTGAGSAMVIFIPCFSISAYKWHLGRIGLDMTMLAIGTSMLVAAAAQTNWRAPRILTPLRKLGQRSYEVYLTHEFVVIALFAIFTSAGKPMKAVPFLFVGVILIAALLGAAVARIYSEPLNHWLRHRWKDGPRTLGSVVDQGA
jgi:peptidoglycan/LPS O-acetylase OafA/YrhL